MNTQKIPKRIRSPEYHQKKRELHAFKMINDPDYREKQKENAAKYRRKKGIKIAIRYKSKEEKRIAKNKRHVDRYANDIEYRNRCLQFAENLRRKRGVSDLHSKRNVTHKICSKCKTDQSINNFRMKKGGSIHSQCHNCENIYHTKRNKETMSIILQKQKKRVEDLVDSYVIRKIVRENKFNITVTKEMIEIKRLQIMISRECDKAG